jgi:hypothetical protein
LKIAETPAPATKPAAPAKTDAPAPAADRGAGTL